MLSTIMIYVFFGSFLVLFVLDAVEIDKAFMHGDLVLRLMSLITVTSGTGYGIVTFLSCSV